MAKVIDILNFLDEEIPFSNKCEWDNCGLLIGDGNAEVKKIGFTLDLTKKTLQTAIRNGVNLIITHHPVIFRPQKNFLKGNIVFEAAVNNISVISSHTCYDSAKGGVSEILAERIGLRDTQVVETEEKPYCVRIGKIDAVSPREFAEKVAEKLDTTVRFTEGKNIIKTVAVCSGSGGDFVFDALKANADAYVTGDISHHDFLIGEETGLTIIGAGHFETENIAMKPLMERINKKFSDIETMELLQENPVVYVSPKEK